MPQPNRYGRPSGDIPAGHDQDAPRRGRQPGTQSGDADGTAKLLQNAFVASKDMAPTTFNEWLINTGDKLILVDTGYANEIGPLAGKLPKTLAAAGVNPADIDAVVITHIHPDHCNGLLTAEKQIAFPNATIRANKLDADYWLDDTNEKTAPAFLRPMFEGDKASLRPYIAVGRFVPFEGSLPRVRSLFGYPYVSSVRMRSLSSNDGYYILGLNGTVWAFGNAKYFGSLSGTWAVDLMQAP